MKTNIISIPTKKTEEVNWSKPLNNYLLSIYGNTSDFQQDLNNLNQLRQELKSGVSGDLTGLKLYLKYYSLLELLDLRVPFGLLNKNKRISFSWFDSFNLLISYKQYSLPFEKASVLFNVGCLLSEVAIKKYSESTDESTKEAILLLQEAAGTFQFLSENFLHAPSNDLSQSTMKFLIQLMLAQAQEIFTLKVISSDLEQKKNSLISKLCQATADFYDECFRMSRKAKSHSLSSPHDEDEDEEDDITEADVYDDDSEFLGEYDPDANTIESDDGIGAINPSWTAIFEFKFHYYSSLALYFHGLNCEATKKYGDAIAYLSKSVDLLEKINSVTLRLVSKLKTYNLYELLDNHKSQKDSVAIKVAELEKDNDFIYNEIVPLKLSLPVVKPMVGIKIFPITNNAYFKEINEYNYSNFLSNVVPINIHELTSFYSEEKSQFLRNEIDLFDVSNQELSSIMEYLQMPKSLVNLKESINSNEGTNSNGSTSSITIPDELLIISEEISLKYSVDDGNKHEIQRLKAEIFSVIQKCEKNKNNEGLRKLKKSFIDASNRDKELFGLVLNEDTPLYQKLSNGPNSKEFQQLFTPNVANKQNPNEELSLLDIDDSKLSSEELIKKKIHDLEEILHDLRTIKTSKSNVIEKLKADIHNEDISDILIINAKVKTDSEIKNQIFPEELKKFDKYSKELDGLVSKQKSIQERLSQEWENLSKDSKVKEIQTSSKFQKELLVYQDRKIKQFYEKWKTYSSRLVMGVQFYKSLLAHANGVYKAIEEQNEAELAGKMGGLDLQGHHPKYGASMQSLQSATNVYQHQQQPAPQPQSLQQQYSGFAPYQTQLQALIPPPQQHAGFAPYQTQQQAPTAPPQQHTGFGMPTGGPQSTGFNSRTSSISNQPTGFGQQGGSHFSGAPQLPPKPISHTGSYTQGYGGQPSGYGQVPPQPQPQHHAPAPQQNNPQGNLIYNQPSSYQPDMYNSFASR